MARFQKRWIARKWTRCSMCCLATRSLATSMSSIRIRATTLIPETGRRRLSLMVCCETLQATRLKRLYGSHSNEESNFSYIFFFIEKLNCLEFELRLEDQFCIRESCAYYACIKRVSDLWLKWQIFENSATLLFLFVWTDGFFLWKLVFCRYYLCWNLKAE